jgi:alkylated DNA repair dioxygenase AlkB
MRTIIKKEGLVEYYSQFFTPDQSQFYFDILKKEINWQPDKLTIFGKHITTKRKVAWYGDKNFEYIYSNNKKIAKPWTETLKKIKTQLQTFTGEQFNACLLNYYHNGHEGMAWHSDDEPMMKKHATIASISFGAKRCFMFRHKQSKEQHALDLENGSLLLMCGTTQEYWKHSLPVRKLIQAPRINLTFRYFEENI